MYKNTHEIRPGLHLEAESTDMQHHGRGGGHLNQQEAICNRMSVLVNIGSLVHTHTETTHKHAECKHVCSVALPAAGSSLMNVDCMLEPLGTEPSGSVCLVHQLAFTEAPMTALDPALRERLTDYQWTLFSGSVCPLTL